MKEERKVYLKEDFNKILSEIYEVISYYKQEYNNKPIMIILSHNLFFGIEYMNFSGQVYDPMNNTNTLFGIECKESPVLTDLEYKVY